MKKNYIFIILLLSVQIIKTDQVNNLRRAIKEGNHTEVLELSRGLAVSQEESNRLDLLATKNLEKRSLGIMPLNYIASKLGLFGAMLGGLISACGAKAVYDLVQKKQNEPAAIICFIFEPICIGATIGSFVLSRKCLTQLRHDAEEYHNATKIAEIIKGLKINAYQKPELEN